MGWYNHFSATGTSPKTETLNITCGGIREDADTLEYSEPWRTTFDVPPPESNEEEEEEEPVIKSCHFEDAEGNTISAPLVGTDVVFVIISENAAGESVDISLSDNTKNFVHNGEVLEDDILSGISLSGDTHKETLTIIAQNN